MTEEEQLIEIGEAAETVLAQPAFNRVINTLVDSTFQSFVNSDPKEKEERERTYSHYRALVDVVDTLKQQVAVKDGILVKQHGDTRLEESKDHE